LCNFTFDEYKQVLKSVLTTGKKLHLDTRMRLKASVLDKPMRNVFKGNDLYQSQLQEIYEYHVMNEVVVDRGPSPYAI
jgi:NAD+ kinase